MTSRAGTKKSDFPNTAFIKNTRGNANNANVRIRISGDIGASRKLVSVEFIACLITKRRTKPEHVWEDSRRFT